MKYKSASFSPVLGIHLAQFAQLLRAVGGGVGEQTASLHFI